MMSRLRSFVPLLVMLVVAVLVPAFALAQAPEPSPAPVPPDYAATLANAITALVPLVVPLLVYGIRLLVPAIPRVVLPFLALGFGMLLDFLTALAAGGSSSLVRGALLGAAGVFVREILSTLNEHGVSASFKNTVGALLIGAVGLVGLQGCANTGPAQRYTYTGLATTKAALDLVQDTLLVVECGKAGAPQAPLCVPADKANAIHTQVAKAYRIHADAVDVALNIPPEIALQPNPKVLTLISEMWDLIAQIRALFTVSEPRVVHMQSELAKLRAQ